MRKGKLKKSHKKYLSVVLVPHSSNHVKVFKFTSLYLKLTICFVFLIGIFVCGGLYISKILGENQALRLDINELYSANTDQRKLIEEKTNEIDKLKFESATFAELVNDKIEEYTESFNKLTDEYITERTNSKPSRAGERNEADFSHDIKELKERLDSLTELYSRSDVPSADLTAAEKKLEAYLETIPTLWPTKGRITDKFGYRKDPFTRRTKFHNGLDIAADMGTDIVACASGKVIMAEFTRGYGRVVKIDHGRGIVTVYGHASKLLVKVGDTVKKGDIIAKVGSSGRSTGPHLHFELLLYNTPVDPLQYLDQK